MKQLAGRNIGEESREASGILSVPSQTSNVLLVFHDVTTPFFFVRSRGETAFIFYVQVGLVLITSMPT